MRSKNILYILLFFGSITAVTIGCSSEEKNGIEEIVNSEETDSPEEPVTPEEPNTDTTDQDNEGEQQEQASIVWKNWYLSVPINRGNGKATSIFYEAIESDALTTDQKKYFYKNTDGSYTFYTEFTGYTTSGESTINGGKYCRTELREFWKGNQSTTDNWYMDEGTHEMESTLQVNSCGGTGRTYVAQIHAKSSPTSSGSAATVKVQWKNGDIVIEYYVKPDSGEPWTSAFDEKITIGNVGNEKFTIKLRVLDGKLDYALICEAKNIDLQYQTLYDYVGNGYDFDNYFKTGNYFKWNSDYTESAEVILYSVKTAHN